MLRDLLIHTAAKDTFPQITMFGVEEMSLAIGLIDNKHVRKDSINRNFIASNQLGDSGNDTKANALSRYEFIEFLVRMSVFKYKEAPVKLARNAVESFERFINELLIPYHSQKL